MQKMNENLQRTASVARKIPPPNGICHKTTPCKVAIIGSPNVGKSVVFNALCGQYVTVSNYPGTTVEVSRGKSLINHTECEVIDTPGLYSLLPITEEERVAQRILLRESPQVVVQIIDAKNLERMLPMTLQLIEASLPLILVLNMMDEAEKEGVLIDGVRLSTELGVDVIPAVATEGKGIRELEQKIAEFLAKPASPSPLRVRYTERVEVALEKIASRASSALRAVKTGLRATALLLLQNDEEIVRVVRNHAPAVFPNVQKLVDELNAEMAEPINYHIAVRLRDEAHRIASKVVTEREIASGFAERLSRLMIRPLTGLPILFVVLYLGLYKFVGSFGAGTVVDFLEGTLFEERINPLMVKLFGHIVPWQILRDLFVGEYGVLTLGVRYAVALILPVVTFFFIVFAIIEDTGYLPRLALLVDRTFKKIGLSGRAVIPMVLGLGCDTMATMVTRTLPTKRERVIATLLLALAVPCSAQLGVILALLEGRPGATLIWAGVVVLVFLLIGYLTAKILPGERASFYMEVPPLRLPQLSNVLIKTYVRVKWYFREVLPLFLLASVLIWVGQLTGLFDLLVMLLRKPVGWIGLPDKAAEIFLFGFFRRDYGAAGLYDLNKQSVLDGVQLVVACVALTLFLPCIAQFLMNVKERGWKTGVGISVFILFFSFAVAFVLNVVLRGFGVLL